MPIYDKLFEGIIFNSLYNNLEESKLLTAHQFGS